MLDKDNKHGRLFIAYVLLITLFVMTFCSIGLSIIIRTIPLKFFADCWKLAIALASLTFLIGVYICWEDDICGPSRRSRERLHIHNEQMQTFASNR
ncbi:hypothetical protein AVEN_216810-1 [Araneus ventricosus]|uniref:Uncharacterized protein n=1 Tax=Araneus ventricosus TaxID=182803 RepID=A0A4Y2K7Z8_ARAVE|nr:hypothetical protein AVEN_216810-1 [Araneus ventricosus]